LFAACLGPTRELNGLPNHLKVLCPALAVAGVWLPVGPQEEDIRLRSELLLSWIPAGTRDDLYLPDPYSISKMTPNRSARISNTRLACVPSGPGAC